MLHCNGNYCNTNLDNWQKYRLMSWVLSCHNAKRDFYRLIFSTALNQNWSKNFHRIFWEAQTLSLMLDELITYRVRQQVMRFSHDFCKILAIVCSPGWLIDASWFQNAKKYFFAKKIYKLRNINKIETVYFLMNLWWETHSYRKTKSYHLWFFPCLAFIFKAHFTPTRPCTLKIIMAAYNFDYFDSG